MTLPVTYAGKLLQENLYEVYGATDVDTLALCKLIDEAIEKAKQKDIFHYFFLGE